MDYTKYLVTERKLNRKNFKDKAEFSKDASKLVKVIHSVKTSAQLETAKSYFENFLKKYKHYFDEKGLPNKWEMASGDILRNWYNELVAPIRQEIGIKGDLK